MRVDEPRSQDFSEWDGTPFFQDVSSEGRRVYVLRSEADGSFTATGRLDVSSEDLFTVRGRLEDLDRFLEEMKVEGAAVTYGAPPLDTATGGDKAGSSTTKPGRKDTK